MSHCDFISGWIAGISGIAVSHPIDTIKTKQQILGASIRKVSVEIFRQENFKGFYRGLTLPLLSSGALNSIFFGFYGISFDFLQGLSNDGSKGGRVKKYIDTYLSGCIGGFACLGLACPVDLIKVKLQDDTMRGGGGKKYMGSFDCFRSILKTHGIRGLYQGMGAMTYRDIPAWGLYTVIYLFFTENGRGEIEDSPNSFKHFIAGGFAGLFSWWSIIPLDVIKSRIQADDPENRKYKGMVDCAKTILRENGITGLYRGFWSVSLRAFPVNGVTFLAYEWLTFLCNPRNDRFN